MAGVGLWWLDSSLEVVAALVFGYTPPATPDTYPRSFGQAAVVFVALALAAPLCEEVLFRGYLQRAYAAKGRRWGVIVVGLLFALFHFRLQGLVALLPIAFSLGYLRARSDSLWPGVAAHFANNALAAIVLGLVGLRPDWLAYLPVGSLPGALVGLGLVVTALWLFNRRTEPAASVASASPTPTRFTLGASLPLVGAGLLYLSLASLEFVLGRNPEWLVTGRLTLAPAPWTQTTRWAYDLRNILDESVGQSECVLTLAGPDYVLNCQTQVRAFEVELPGSLYQAGNETTHLSMRWGGAGLNALEGEIHKTGDGRDWLTRLEPAADGPQLVVTDADGTQTLALPGGALMPEEWPWRLMALPFSVGLNQQADFAWPSRWQPDLEQNQPAVDTVVVTVSGAEPVAVPAGNFIAWRVRIGTQTAWYDVNAPHTLLRYDAGFATYVLTTTD
jgi:hypothetical protein